MRYAGEARESVNELRLNPLDGDRQTVSATSISVSPDAEVFLHTDAFGNRVAWFQVDGPHPRLVVEATALVDVRPAPREVAEVPWEALADPAFADAHAEYLLPSPLVHWPEPVERFAQEVDAGDHRDVLGWLGAMEHAVNRAVVYERGHTAVDTPVERVVQARRGVCQDLAHLFIALCRRRGVPARYVSGWLHLPDRDEPSESHAWAEARVPGVGWVEFDPTHPSPDLSHHIRVGVGRDYTDVPPFRGTYVGDPTEAMEVTVEIREVPVA